MRPTIRNRIVLLVFAVVGVYGASLGYGFVGFDDPDYVTANPIVQRGLSADGVKWAFTTHAAQNWHPLTWLSLMLLGLVLRRRR